MTELTAAEWATPFAGSPPGDIRPVVDEIVRSVASLAPPAAPGDYVAVPDRPRTVTVFGGRGQGKSTALVFAVGELKARGYLVLPVVDPERFATGDTLLGWVVAELERMLTVELAPPPGAADSVLQLLDMIARHQALVSGDYVDGLATRGVTPEEYARDVARIPAAGVRFSRDWAKLMDAIADLLAKPSLQVVIPVDDADLHPTLLPSLISDAQLLGASPRTIVLTAADESTLRDALLIGSLLGIADAHRVAIDGRVISPESLREAVDRQVVKHFPRSLRVRIEPLAPDARLAYHPVHCDLPLVDLLRRHEMRRPGVASLADLFEVRSMSGDPVDVTGFAECLSDNRRDLRQLYEAIERIDPAADDATSRAFVSIIEHGLDTVGQAVPRDFPPPLRIAPRRAADGGLQRIELRLEGVGFGRVAGLGKLVFRWPHNLPDNPFTVTDFASRGSSNFYMWFGDDDSASDEDVNSRHEGRQRIPAPDRLTHLVLLAWEGYQFAEAGENLVDLSRMLGKIVTPGLLNWTNQMGAGRRQDARWRYWQVPDWECHSDYFVFVAGWNRFQLLFVPSQATIGRTEHIELLMLAHLDLVVTVQESHRVPDRVATSTLSSVADLVRPDTWPDERNAYVEDLTQRITKTTEACLDSILQRDADFVTWVAVALPFLAVRTTATATLSQWILSLWRSLPLRDSDREAASWALYEEIGSHLDDERADAELAILEEIDPKRAGSLRNLRDVLGRRLEAQRQGVLHALRENNTPTQLIDALLTQGATSEVLTELQSMNFSPDDLVTVARAFPPVSDPDPAVITDSDIRATETS